MRVPLLTADYVRDADVTVATTCENALLLEAYGPEKGRPFYLLQHDEGLYHFPREVADRAYKTRARKIVVSSWLQDILATQHGEDSDLLINPIDLAQFKKLPIDRKDDTVRILVLQHPYAWKGTAEGVAAVEEVRKAHPEVRLVMFGVREKDNIGFTPDEYHFNVPQDKLAELYSGADIYLCPSWDEGFGLPSIEAMACGLALVTYDNGGSRDYAFHEDTALVARRRDTEDLTVQLERAVSDASLRRRISERGRGFVLGMPGWEQRVTELEELLSRP